MGPELVKPHHLRRRAVIYVRQSTPHQVLTNQESLRLQYALQHRAREFGWHEADIDVIDSDLGMSGAATDHRQGFKDLVARVMLGQVGIIVSIEVTRLARNCSDWYPLLDVCGHRQCLICRPRRRLRSGNPERQASAGFEGHHLGARIAHDPQPADGWPVGQGGTRRAGVDVAGRARPGRSGVVTKTPDLEVHARVALVFDTFLKRRTAVRVVRTLHERGLSLPRRDRDGQPCWKRPTIPAVTTMLKNPAYAGAFVYGRTRMGPGKGHGGRVRRKLRPDEEWRIVVKGKYPAYLDWETFERIQAMLRDNRAEYLQKTRGIPRDGAAPLHGIAWCGECGHKMAARYKGGSQYVCNHLRQQRDAPVCQCLRSAAIDRSVAAAFWPPSPLPRSTLGLARGKAQRQSDGALRRSEMQQIDRLRYEARLAERQFNRVDPDDRLVAAELERRWEAALLELRRAEEALARRTATAAPGFDRLDPGAAREGRCSGSAVARDPG